jgi:orotate phosphoribosyltransferase-like protein
MPRRTYLPDDAVLVRLRDRGMTHQQIATMYEVSRPTVTKRLAAIDEAAMHSDSNIPQTEVISTRKG